MIKAYAFLLALFSLYSSLNALVLKRPWQFSEDLIQQTPYSQPAPLIAHQQNNSSLKPLQQSEFQETSALENKDIYSALNAATLCYVLFELYSIYKDIYLLDGPLKENADSYLMQAIKGLIIYLSPQFLINLGNHSKFLLSALAITLTALIYKTIIKLIIFSAQGDVFDLLSGFVARILKLLKATID